MPAKTAKLPKELRAPANETEYALLFMKGKRQWVVHLWSNQVTSCAISNAPKLGFERDSHYKFVLPNSVKLRQQGFYKASVPSKEQRRRAVAEYTKRIVARLRDGYELVADSRVLEKAAKARARTRAKSRTLTPAQIRKLTPWNALKYFGTLHTASDDKRVQRVAERFEDATEPEVQFAALCSLPATSEKITLPRNVVANRFNGEFLWIRGDLHVKGDLETDVDLFVSGDLTVDGVVSDLREWTHILVGGSVEAGALDVGSQLYAAGGIAAELVVIDGTGALLARKGLRARLLVEEGFAHHVKAKVTVKHRVNLAKSPEAGVAALEKVLAPTLAAAVRRDFEKAGEDFYFEKSIVIDAWKARKRVWR
jgi:hypothetical protein